MWRMIDGVCRSINYNQRLADYENDTGFCVQHLIAYIKDKMNCNQLPDGFYMIDHQDGTSDYYPYTQWSSKIERELYVKLLIDYEHSEN